MTRFAPSSFDPSDPQLDGIRRTDGWRWESCEHFLREFRARTVLVRLPLFWQIEMPLYDVTHAAGATIFMNEPDNMPVGLAAIASAEANVVLTEADDAARFSVFLAEKNRARPDAWILIHPEGAQLGAIPVALAHEQRIAQEVHLFPGVPILVQCSALATAQEPVFHTAAGCDVLESGDAISIDTIDPVRSHHMLSRPLSKVGDCSCGESLFRRV